jgi:hypothetical protein
VSDLGGWLEKFTYLHDKNTDPDAPPVYTVTGVYAITNGYSLGNYAIQCSREGAYMPGITSTASVTAKLDLAQIDAMPSAETVKSYKDKGITLVNDQKLLTKTQTITFGYNSGYFTDYEARLYDSIEAKENGGHYISIKENSQNGITRVGNTFNIRKLDYDQRMRTVIYISGANYGHIGSNCQYMEMGQDGVVRYHPCCDTIQVSVDTNPLVTLGVKRSDCFINMKHDYVGSVTWEENYTKAKAKFICQNDSSHVEEVTLEGDDITCTSDDKFNIYTASADAYIPGDSYTVRVPKGTTDSADDYIPFSEGVNILGKPRNHAEQHEAWYPAGSASQYIYKSAATHVDFTIKPDVIKAGAKAILIDVSYSAQLDGMDIVVLDKDNNPLTRNNTESTPYVSVDMPNKTVLGSRLNSSINIVDLSGFSDLELYGCSVRVTRKASTTNYSDRAYDLSAKHVPDAYTSIIANGIKIYY